MDILWGIGGMVGLLAIAYACSTNRKAIKPRTVGAALALQVGFGVLVLYWPAGKSALEATSRAVQAVINTANEGIGFLFGPLIPEDGLVFAFQVLPVIVFFASLSALLYHIGVLQKVVEVIGGGLRKLLGTGRAESVNAAANIFVGQTEAPLIIRPYIPSLTRSGLFAVMVGGLSTVAGSVLVGYSLMGANLEYLIAASFMAAPGALLMAKMLVPETEDLSHELEVAGVGSAGRGSGRSGRVGSGRVERRSQAANSDESASSVAAETSAEADPDSGSGSGSGSEDDILGPEGNPQQYRNVIDAIAGGAADGLRLALTIGAMLLAFISLIALLNLIIGGVGGWFGADDLTFEQILGYVFAPIMVLIGVPLDEAVQAGSYLGQKTVLNEFVAFSSFGPESEAMSDKAAAIVTFALTGFANLGSLGILLGGLGGMAPARRGEIAELGLRAILAGTLANLMSAAIAGVLIG